MFFLQAGKNISSSSISEKPFANAIPCYGGNGIRGYVKSSNRSGDYPIIGRQGALCGNINRATGDFYATEHAVCVTTFSNTNVSWACVFLKALNLNQYATATAQPGLAVGTINRVLIPVPPVTEQRRITEKLYLLEPLLASYESTHDLIINQQHDFPEQLKKSILQEAVQGKLVPQDPTDEPASALLERIRAEKEQLIKSGKIKRDKHESVIFRRDNSYYERVDGIERCIDDEIPFEIPDNWEWVRIKHVGRITTGNTPSRIHPEYFGADIPFVSPGDIHDGKIDIPSQGLSFEGMKVGRIIPQGSILQVCIGGSIGKAAICDFDISFNQQINAIEPIICNSKYLFYAISAPYFISRVKDKAGGTATPIISKGQWENMLMPLSPLKEQQRIATRIDNLLHKLMVL